MGTGEEGFIVRAVVSVGAAKAVIASTGNRKIEEIVGLARTA